MTPSELDVYMQGTWLREAKQLSKVRKLQHTLIKMLGSPEATRTIKEEDLYRLITDIPAKPIRKRKSTKPEITKADIEIIRKKYNLR